MPLDVLESPPEGVGRSLRQHVVRPARPMRRATVDDVVKAVVSGKRRIVVVDVEATCWKKGVFSRNKETIEIGAVLLLPDRAPSQWPEFQTFVRPLRLPRLSSFCRELTGITQENVDAAPGFPEALRLFLEWSQPLERVVLADLEPLQFVAARSRSGGPRLAEACPPLSRREEARRAYCGQKESSRRPRASLPPMTVTRRATAPSAMRDGRHESWTACFVPPAEDARRILPPLGGSSMLACRPVRIRVKIRAEVF